MLVWEGRDEEILRLGLPDGRTVDVKILPRRGNKIRLGIEAPADVAILWGRETKGFTPPANGRRSKG